jgi:hypothetical protein
MYESDKTGSKIFGTFEGSEAGFPSIGSRGRNSETTRGRGYRALTTPVVPTKPDWANHKVTFQRDIKQNGHLTTCLLRLGDELSTRYGLISWSPSEPHSIKRCGRCAHSRRPNGLAKESHCAGRNPRRIYPAITLRMHRHRSPRAKMARPRGTPPWLLWWEEAVFGG